ncbi:MAG: efflux RND transporter periplasmic adaptor subunit [Luteimonas sp.]
MASTHRFWAWRRRPLAALLAVSFALLAGCGSAGEGNAEAKTPETDKAADAVPVEVVRVARRPIAASYTGTAPLEPLAESQVVAKTSGVALAVLAEEGQQVSAGQVLVRLDPDRARLQAAQSAAQVRKLEASYTRSQALIAQQLISANDLDQLKYDLENARAVNNLANLELSYSNVVAPISGVIATRSIKTGNFVQINTPIFRIVDDSQLEAILNVPERELATLQAGLPVLLQADALPGRTFKGRVDRVSPVIDAGSGTFRVVCAFDGRDRGVALPTAAAVTAGQLQAGQLQPGQLQPGQLQPGQLQPGMFGRIRIDYDQRADALVIPRIALLDDQGEPAVYAVRGTKAVRVAIKAGYSDGEWTEVLSGLSLGDAVITAGKVALRDGSVVQVIGRPAATKSARAASAAASGAKQ